MTKLYKKSEIGFAILWIIVYVVGTSIADSVSTTIGFIKLFTVILHITLCLTALIWIKKHNLLKKYGLCKAETKASKFLYYIPLLIVISCNTWFGLTMNMTVTESIIYVISMLCVGLLEELIFRGFLFKAMSRNNIKSAIVVSCLTFGIGHVVNLINGSGEGIVSTSCQIIYAIALGLLFTIIFYKSKSLLPCIFTHGAMNALSAFADSAKVTEIHQIIISSILAFISIIYIFVILNNTKTSIKNHGDTLN